MNEEKETLGLLLKNLEIMNPGDRTKKENLYFSMWYNHNGKYEKIEKYNLSNKLEFWLCKKDKNWIWYQISTKDKKLEIISNGKGWEIDGGTMSPDNPSGDYFLKMSSLENFPNKIEVRIYILKNKNQFSMN